jgi:purine nucleoside permease
MNSTPLLFLLLSLAVLFAPPRTEADPIRPKVLILTTFEIGADTGELQYWVEREKLTGTLDIPGLLHPPALQ